MTKYKPIRFLFTILILTLVLILIPHVQAQDLPSKDNIVQGALLYDKWYAALGVEPPATNMPLWQRQTTNTRSGADTWRCVECHGWDYRGVEGAYGSGSHYTGFPDIKTFVETLDESEIIAHLSGSKDPAHDFSAYLNENSLSQLAVFLKNGIIDDSEYIDPVSLRILNADITNGKNLFQATCTECHGEDGKKIIFRTEGINEYLGSVAIRDPWRFLHRTRFGTAGTNMPIGYTLGWTPSDGRDILAYAQTLPTGGEISLQQPTTRPGLVSTPLIGGPATNIWTGILTGLGTFTAMTGYALVFIGAFLLIGVIVVTILRRRKT